MPDPFITNADVVSLLGRGDAADAGLTIAVDAACSMVRTLTEQDFNVNTAGTALLDGSGTDALLLPQLPVTQVDAVLVDGTAVTDFVVRKDGVLIRTVDSAESEYPVATWPEGRQNVSIAYRTGYSATDMPRDVKMVALSIASRLWLQGPLSRETVGQVSVTYATTNTDLTNGERAILRKYRVAR